MFGNTERARPGEVNPCFGDSGGASRFMYVAKASRADREDGLEGRGFSERKVHPALNTRNGAGERLDGAESASYRNHHPTVKPTDLMRWLCRLVTPPGGTVLDPFAGSGSTGVAALSEGFDFIGIEKDADYVEIARRRIANVAPLFAQGGAA
jgi:site-specific DNA-methyltransferase (adenine-specific)